MIILIPCALTPSHMHTHLCSLQERSPSCPLPPWAGLFNLKLGMVPAEKRLAIGTHRGAKLLGCFFFSVCEQEQMDRGFYGQKMKFNKCVFQCLDRSVQGNPGGVSTGTLGTGTLSCSHRGFTSPSTLNQLPTARQKHQNSPKGESGISCHSNSTSGHDHQNGGGEFSTNTQQSSFSVATSSADARNAIT